MRNVQKEIREVIKEVASETGLDYQVIEDIYIQEFEYIASQVSRGERNNFPTFENILVKHLGSFIANEKHINKLKQIADEKENRERNQDCS